MNPSTERIPPSDLAAEQHVLCCCLLDNGISLKHAVEVNLAPEDFFTPANRMIFSTLLEEREAGKDIGFDGLMLDLKASGKLAKVGVDTLFEIRNTTELSTFFKRNLAVVQEKSTRRALIAAATELVEESHNGADVPELMALAERTIRPVTKAVSVLPKLEAIRLLEERRISLAKPESEPVVRLFLAGKPIATPGNLITLISKAKTGKTATIGGAVAAIIAAAGKITDFDTLGFTASNPEGQALILIDTEQSPYDAYLCYKRAVARVTPDPENHPVDTPWVCPYSLVGYSVPDLKKALHLAAEQAKKNHKGVFAIILDGVADFVLSVNDEAECNNFVSELRALAVQYECPIVCVIHSNEAVKAGDDGRGHLGKQLTRKAESNLLLKKVGEVTVITSEKQRKAPITEEDGVAFTWSDEDKRHVSCSKPTSPRDVAKLDRSRELATEVFTHLNKATARYAELVKAISEVRAVGASRAEDRFTEMKKTGVISKDLMGFWKIA